MFASIIRKCTRASEFIQWGPTRMIWLLSWKQIIFMSTLIICDDRAELLRCAHDQNWARVYLSAATSSAAARVETAEEPVNKKSSQAVGLAPQDKSCSRRVRGAESGFEGKSLCERLAWVLEVQREGTRQKRSHQSESASIHQSRSFGRQASSMKHLSENLQNHTVKRCRLLSTDQVCLVSEVIWSRGYRVHCFNTAGHSQPQAKNASL